MNKRKEKKMEQNWYSISAYGVDFNAFAVLLWIDTLFIYTYILALFRI